MANYKPEKKYTNHALMDEIVYNTQLILKDLTVKNDMLANMYETQETVDSYEIYIMCVNNTVSFDVFPFTEEIIIAYADSIGIVIPPEVIVGYMNNKNNIPLQMREPLLNFSKKYYIDNFVEKNIYYRSLNGLPPIDQLPEEYIYCDSHWFPDRYINSFIDPDYERARLESLQVYELSDREIAILSSNGIIDMLIDKYRTKGIRTSYLRHLGARKIDIIDARKAKKWEILYIIRTSEDLVSDRFTELYTINREMYLRRSYQECFSFDSDYYDELCIIMLISQTFNDMIIEIPEWYIRRDIFDIRSVQYFLESYGVQYFKRIPLKYQIRIVKNLNKLIKYKSSDYGFVDILDIFEVPDTKIYKYFLIKNLAKKDPELQFVQVEMGDIYDDYIKDSNNRTTYDEITYADKYWDGVDSHSYIRNLIMNKDFTIEGTKYYSIDYEVNMGKFDFQTSYFINLLFTNGLNTDDIRMVISSIDPEIEFKLSDLFLLIFCFNLSYYDMDTSVIVPEEREKHDREEGYYIDYDGGYPTKYNSSRDDILEECKPLLLERKEKEYELEHARETINYPVKVSSTGEQYIYKPDDTREYPVYRKIVEYNEAEVERLNNEIEDIDNRIQAIINQNESDDEYVRMLDGAPGKETKMDNYFQLILTSIGDGKYKTKDGLILWNGCFYDRKEKKVYSSIEEFVEAYGKYPAESATLRLLDDDTALLEGPIYKQLQEISLYTITVNDVGVEWNEHFLTADGGDPSTYHNVNEEDFYHWMKKYYSDLYYEVYCFDDTLNRTKTRDRIVAFNMDADLNKLQKLLDQAHSKFHYLKGWKLSELLGNEDGEEMFINTAALRDGKIKELYDDPENIPIDDLINVYHNNRRCYENLQNKMIYETDTMDEYRVYKFVFEYLFTIARDSEGHTYGISRYKYSDLVEMLAARDYILYEYFQNINSITDLEARQDQIQLALDQIVDTLEYYLKNHDLDYVLNVAQINTFFSMVTYIRYMLQFFKSYKVQFLDPYNTFIIDNKCSPDGSGDGQYHRAKDVITELEIEDHYQDKHFIKDLTPYTEVELDIREHPSYHEIIKEKMDIIGHFEPDPYDDYDYDGMTPTLGQSEDYKDADGGNESEDVESQPYFTLNGGKPQLLLRNLWNLDGGGPRESLNYNYIDLDGGRSLHVEDTKFPRNNFYLPDDYNEGRFNPKSTKFTYVIDGGTPSNNIFRSRTMVTRVLDRQVIQDVLISTNRYNELKTDENGELYIAQQWTSWEEFDEWKPIVEETFEKSEEFLDEIADIIEVLVDQDALDRRIIEERDELLYGLENTLYQMNGNRFENSLNAYTDERNNTLIETFNGFNPFEWADY